MFIIATESEYSNVLISHFQVCPALQPLKYISFAAFEALVSKIKHDSKKLSAHQICDV